MLMAQKMRNGKTHQLHEKYSEKIVFKLAIYSNAAIINNITRTSVDVGLAELFGEPKHGPSPKKLEVRTFFKLRKLVFKGKMFLYVMYIIRHSQLLFFLPYDDDFIIYNYYGY